ncbi:MAG TPA: hypothetical protein VE359_05570, partial [Vicinamibacteria bacterium]|nr:hypothetical protein [Vicinamibacteria bacterium]
PAAVRAPALLEAPATPARPLPAAARRDEPPADPRPSSPSAASGSAESLLAAMIGLCQGRPSLAAALRSAAARLEGDTLAIEVSEDFLAFATMHADELRDLARRASGRSLVLKIAAGGAAPSTEPAGREPAEDRRQTLREEAEKEKAVQEALDLFDGRVVDVREAKTSREDA